MSAEQELHEEVLRLRVPPHSIEAEQSVLGGLLLDNQAWDRVGDMLVEGDFYRHEHRQIYAAIASLVNSNKPADVITVFERVQALGKGADCGGLAYLNSLAGSVPSAANIRRYSEIVRERAILRRLAAAGDAMSTSAFNTQGRALAELLDEAERSVFSISEERQRGGGFGQSIDQLVVKLIDRVNELHENGAQDVTGVRTGFYELDRMTAGLQPCDLIVLAARPSMGKTALAINIGEQIALHDGRPVVVFSMEMSAEQLASRMTASIGRVNQSSLRTGRLTDDEWGRLSEAVEKLGKCVVHIDDRPAMTPAEIRAAARRYARECGQLGLIVVDYLQLMSAGGGGNHGSRADNRATEIGEITRSLKALAKELRCPVLALSQLNRSVESRTDKRPMMSDLRESGAIEQDADVIMFIYRDEYYNKESREPGIAELILSKQRNGPVGTVRLAFQKQFSKFDNLAPDYMPPLPSGGTFGGYRPARDFE